MRNYRSNTNRLANLKNNTVVSKAIQRDRKDKRTTAMLGAGVGNIKSLFKGVEYVIPVAGAIGVGAHFLKGIGTKAIGQAFRKAGTAGNKKGADTVGNRIKQTEAMIGKKRFDKTRIASQYQGTEHGTHGASLAFKAGNANAKTSISKIRHDGLMKKSYGTFQQRKTDRIITNAVEKGPAKYFSKVKSNSKTGVVRNKRREKHGTASHNPEDGWQPNFGAEGGTSKGSLFKYRKDMGMVQETIKTPSRSNRLPSVKGSLLLNKGSLLFNNKTLKSYIDAMNKTMRNKPKK